MLVHFPATWGGVGGKALRQEQWKAMEAFQRAGKARAIGVSHYCERHIDDILEIATIKPAVNQVEFHVGMGLQGLNATGESLDHTQVQSYSQVLSDSMQLVPYTRYRNVLYHKYLL
jgi:diketogulonate reductase-like aldo/keto reductase